MSGSDTQRSNANDDFDWKGEAGEKFAEWNKTSAEGKDKEYVEYFGKSASDIFSRAVEKMIERGLDVGSVKVLDIGCSTGGVMAVLEGLGFNADNLSGLDLSPKAIELNQKAHPKYKLEVVQDYSYACRDVGLLYHTGVLCQVPQEDYPKFFGKIRDMKPRFYLCMEGFNPNGYEKIPNSVAHGHHHDHHHEGEGHDIPMSEGYHHTNNFEKVIGEQFPEAKKIHSEQLDFTESAKGWFEPLHMTCCKVLVYQLEN